MGKKYASGNAKAFDVIVTLLNTYEIPSKPSHVQQVLNCMNTFQDDQLSVQRTTGLLNTAYESRKIGKLRLYSECDRRIKLDLSTYYTGQTYPADIRELHKQRVRKDGTVPNTLLELWLKDNSDAIPLAVQKGYMNAPDWYVHTGEEIHTYEYTVVFKMTVPSPHISSEVMQNLLQHIPKSVSMKMERVQYYSPVKGEVLFNSRNLTIPEMCDALDSGVLK